MHRHHEVFTVGMMLMPGAHNAETIKIAIQEMMNRYRILHIIRDVQV